MVFALRANKKRQLQPDEIQTWQYFKNWYKKVKSDDEY
jgi:hypothetical protein